MDKRYMSGEITQSSAVIDLQRSRFLAFGRETWGASRPLSTPALLPPHDRSNGLRGGAEEQLPRHPRAPTGRRKKEQRLAATQRDVSLKFPSPTSARECGCWAQGLAPTGSGRLLLALPGCPSVCKVWVPQSRFRETLQVQLILVFISYLNLCVGL